MKKKTIEDFYNQTNKEYSIVGEFKNYSEKTLIKHNKCGYTWIAKPITLTRKVKPVRCPSCYNGKLTDKKVSDILALKNIKMLGTFSDIHNKEEFECLKCGNHWEATLSNVLYKTSCPACANRLKTKDTNWFKNNLKEMYGNDYTVLSEYIQYNLPIKIRHSCGYEFTTTPNNILHGKECPKCNKSYKKTTNKFKEEVFKKYKNEYTVIGEYTSNKAYITMKHNKCGKTFQVRPNNFLSINSQCPHCFKSSSKGQKELSKFISSITKQKIIENYKLPSKKQIDIFVKDKNIGFEYDGLYWHSEEIVGNKYAIEKTLECKEHGIRLVHIFEDEWESKKSIVKSKIKAILKISDENEEKIYARKCVIKHVPTKDKNFFLNSNHIQGEDNSNIKLGLYYNNELISVMTFCKGRLGIGHTIKNSDIYELSRFANKINCIIVGSFERLLKAFIKMTPTCKTIISYADKRWSDSDSNIYTRNNFIKAMDNKPNYWYFYNKIRMHRFSFRKNILKEKFPEYYSEKLTEHQIMNKTKYKRIWDCGTIRYDLNIN